MKEITVNTSSPLLGNSSRFGVERFQRHRRYIISYFQFARRLLFPSLFFFWCKHILSSVVCLFVYFFSFLFCFSVSLSQCLSSCLSLSHSLPVSFISSLYSIWPGGAHKKKQMRIAANNRTAQPINAPNKNAHTHTEIIHKREKITAAINPLI